MNTFNLYCRKLWIEKKKTFMLVSVAYLGFWALVGLMSGALGGAPGAMLTGSYGFLAGVAGAFIASEMFFDISKKKGRIAELMTPASATDKFVVRLLGVTVGFLVLALAAYFVCEFANMFGAFIFRGDLVGMYNPLNMFRVSYWGFSAEVFVGTIAFYLLITSIFVFGAVTWPRLSFLKTVFLLAVLIILFTIFMAILAVGGHFNNIGPVDPDSSYWVMTGFEILIAVAITWAAYFNFKRKTLMQRL